MRIDANGAFGTQIARGFASVLGLLAHEPRCSVLCPFSWLCGLRCCRAGILTRRLAVQSEFFLLGASAVVLWGYEHEGDGTGGEQPRGTFVTSNFCHEIGIYQKQSSCYFHAVSAESTITRNLFFNGRAAVRRASLVLPSCCLTKQTCIFPIKPAFSILQGRAPWSISTMALAAG